MLIQKKETIVFVQVNWKASCPVISNYSLVIILTHISTTQLGRD